MICKKCGKSTNAIYSDGMCYTCYYYFRHGGTENPIPGKGKIEYDNRGYVVCHICGRAYKRLGSHAREAHNMSIAEYKEQFGLCNNARTTEAKYSKMMRDSALKNGMDKQLLVCGKNTRIKPGEKDKRQGKKSRLQECLDRSKRYIEK